MDFSRLSSDFPVLYKAFECFQGRFDFQESPLNSSTFQACASPAKIMICSAGLDLLHCLSYRGRQQQHLLHILIDFLLTVKK